MKAIILMISLMTLMTLSSMGQNADIDRMMQNPETRNEIFNLIVNNHTYMSDFMKVANGSQHASMMMRQNQAPMNVSGDTFMMGRHGMMNGGRMMYQQDSTYMMMRHQMMTNPQDSTHMTMRHQMMMNRQDSTYKMMRHQMMINRQDSTHTMMRHQMMMYRQDSVPTMKGNNMMKSTTEKKK
jgi:hypothetical protein